MRIRRGCRLPRRKRFRYGPKPNRHPRSLRAASPRSRRKRPRSKRQGPLLAGRAPLPLESKQIRSGATLRRPGHSVLAPGSDRRHALIGRTPARPRQRTMTSARSWGCGRPAPTMRSAQLCIDKLSKPAGVLPGGMWQTRHTAGTMAIALTEIAPRAELIKQPDVKRPGIRAGGHDRNTTPEYWIDGRRLRTCSGGAIPGAVRRSQSFFLRSLRSTHFTARTGHAWDAGRGWHRVFRLKRRPPWMG